MSAAPRLSVVMPAFDAAATIGAAVDSALAQTVTEIEVLVVDDGSTDATVAEVARRAERDARVVLLTQANAGPSAARNRAIGRARGPVVAFLDADDLMLPVYAERMLDRLERRPDVALVACDAYIYDERYGRVRRRTVLDDVAPPTPLPAGADAQFAALADHNFVYVGCAVRTDALRAVGGFPADTRTSEDWDLWLRLLDAGHPMDLLREPLAVYRYSEGQAHRDAAAMARGQERLDAWIRSTGRVGDLRRAGATGAADGSASALKALVPAPLRRALTCRRRPPSPVAAAFPRLGR
ncbi:MAG TPA: glycosyltransferase family A protein [Baekduia sp.]|uniref:glycosyltransferase family 2 protein n=1 Tax=Baekduia sp. TaxID=2600305 RepID=UPI002D76F8BF|nr:glycosyltransferase family A protein [Baekduia sp.]HET6508409.1 glycosyltransferase family A protein [Baekduia sp.]